MEKKKTSSSSWSAQLGRFLSAKSEVGAQRTAIIGIGNELNADDAAGVLVARRLKQELPVCGDVLIIEGATAPENFTGVLRRFGPQRLLLVDCAEMQAEAGEIAWLSWEQVDGLSSSTHTLPPTVLADFLLAELGCPAALLGIQPGTTAFDAQMTPAVLAAVDRIVAEISAWQRLSGPC